MTLQKLKEKEELLDQPNSLPLIKLQELIAERGLLYPLDCLIVGATGVGKSSTINALFNQNIAKVGEGTNPETKRISSYSLSDYIRFHDTAGLGDSPANDEKFSQAIQKKLRQVIRVTSGNRYMFVDLALVILDASSRDLGTTYEILERVILPNIESERVIVALNRCDLIESGRGWCNDTCQPKPNMLVSLENKVQSIKSRLSEATKKEITLPVFYSAANGYNMDVLFNHILKHLPKNRREVVGN